MSRALHGAVQSALNRALELDPERHEVLAPLVGRRVAVEVQGAPWLDVCLSFGRDAVQIDADLSSADVTVSGSPTALASLLSRTDELPAGAGVSVRGDVGLLQQVRRSLMRLRPDWAEPIARVLGDEVGQQVVRGIGHAAALVGRAARELGADASEFLREESDLLVAEHEVAAFAAAVDRMRDQVERLDKRIARLARAAGRRS